MRGLIAVLVVANLILVLWWVFAPRPAEVPPAAPVAASPLILLHEVPPRPQQFQQVPDSGASVAGGEEQGSPLQGCHALGPYPDRELAMVVREQLLEVELQATPRAEDASQRLGFWVHTAPSGDRADADTAVDRLRRAGIRDFYVVADGEFANAVSLGVFSQQDSAERHAERLRSLGFDVVVGERLRRITAWWLDFPTPPTGSAAADRVIELALMGGEGLTLVPKPCD